MKIFIMAQGEGSRWDWTRPPAELKPSEYKQLIPIGDEVLIQRTVRQLEGNKIVLVANQDFFKYCNVIFTLNSPVGTLIEGIAKTKPLWDKDRNIFILGDVVFSNAAIKTILNDQNPFTIFARFAGNIYTKKAAKEIFAVSVRGERLDWFKQLLNSLSRINAQKLWDMYFYLKNRDERIATQINDYTDDCDSPEAYVEFFDIMRECALEDDRNNQ
jgi:hypothetical protein